jgi:exopolysaccharide production protein ExoZ
MKQLIGVQYLRGLAALSVVWYHIVPNVVAQGAETPLLVALLPARVDVLFVISGFIIWTTTQRDGVQAWPWWKNRLMRIVPLYWLALVVVFLVRMGKGAPLPTPDEAWRSFLFVPATNSVTGEFTPFLGPGWTLNYEFFFYIVVAVSLLMPSRAQRVIFMLVLFGSLVALRKVADLKNPIHFRMTSPLFFEFMGGILLAWLYPKLADWKEAFRRLIGVAGVVSSLVVLWVLSFVVQGGPRTIKFGVPAVVLVFSVLLLDNWLRGQVIEPLRKLGDTSFSLYLSHPIAIELIFPILAAVGVTGVAQAGSAALVLCVVIGWMTYRWVEKPLLAALKPRSLARPSAVPAREQGAGAGGQG